MKRSKIFYLNIERLIYVFVLMGIFVIGVFTKQCELNILAGFMIGVILGGMR